MAAKIDRQVTIKLLKNAGIDKNDLYRLLIDEIEQQKGPEHEAMPRILELLNSVGLEQKEITDDVIDDYFWPLWYLGKSSSLGRWLIKQIEEKPEELFPRLCFPTEVYADWPQAPKMQDRFYALVLHEAPELYKRFNQDGRLDLFWINEHFPALLALYPEKFSQKAFIQLPKNPYIVPHVAQCEAELERIAPGKLRQCMQLSFEATLKNKQDQEPYLQWFIDHDGAAALPLVLRYRQKKLDDKSEFLQKMTAIFGKDLMPLLDQQLFPEVLGKAKPVKARDFVEDMVRLLAGLGCDADYFLQVKERFTQNPELVQLIEKTFAARGQAIPSLDDLRLPQYCKDRDWKEQVIAFLQLERGEWPQKRRRLESLCEEILCLEDVIVWPQWPEIVKVVIDQSTDFKTFSKRKTGYAIKAEDDESGLLELWSDEGYLTTDLVWPLLSLPQSQMHAQWPELVKQTLALEKRILGLSLDSELRNDFFALPHVQSRADFKNLT